MPGRVVASGRAWLGKWSPALRSCLFAVFCCLGATVQGAPAHSINDIFKALESQPVSRSGAERARTLLAAPLPEADGADLAKARWERARAAGELGLVAVQLDELRQVTALGGGPDPNRAWRELGMAELMSGNFRNAIAAREKALTLINPNQRGRLISEHAGLADLYRRAGDMETARRHVRNAEGMLVTLKSSPNWQEFQYNWQASVEDALGRNELSVGHYGEAEARFRKALELLEKDLELNVRRLAREGGQGLFAPPQHMLENWQNGIEGWLANSLRKQGRLYEAEFHGRRAAMRALQQAGQDSITTNTSLQQLVLVLGDQNRLATALELADRIQANFQRLGIPPTSYFFLQNRNLRAGLLTSLGRWQEAMAEFDAVRAALGTDHQLAQTLGGASVGRVRTLLGLGRNDEAMADAGDLYRLLKGQLGDKAYETAEALGFLGAAQAAAGQKSVALANLQDAIAVLAPAAAEQTDRSSRNMQRLSFIIEAYLRLLAAVRGTGIEKAAGLDAAAEAFLVADVLRGQSVQQAMAASAVRAAAGTPGLEALVREAQDVRQERDILYANLADFMSRPADQLLPGIVGQMRQRVEMLSGRYRELSEAISRRFPDYADLATPRPVPLSEIQRALRPGEALLSVYSGSDETYVWAVPAKGLPAFAAVPLKRSEVDAMVGTLRASLDPGDVDYEQIPAFDGAIAYRLYQALLGSVEPGWAGAQHLIVAAGGPLGRLPFSVLPTVLPTAGKGGSPLFSEYGNWPWLARRMAISQLPAASSLVTLRRMKPGAPDRLPFVGFGDPLFKLSQAEATAKTRALRAVAFPRRAAGLAEGTVDYGRISSLPDTREEILSLAKVLGGDPQRDVFLGAQASKAQVLGSDLKRRKILAFATHGLLAGEFPGVEQPALALANPGNGQHGLLTLDDILTLKLDADWVVLSACNTAGGEGQGSEAVSGLGRGFFYAGSRALLVTHWPVETVSAKQLVVGVFEALSREPGLSRAIALQRSMLNVMQGSSQEPGSAPVSYAHPLFWAPYALVGDGGM